MSNSSSQVNKTSRPVVLDLFSGAGGMSLGFEAAGFDIGASVEIDPVHSAIHEFNFPYSGTICKSIIDVTTDEIEKKAVEKGFNHIDVVVGGPPCQGFSQIGKRQLNDPRNELVFQYLRVVKDLNPKYFVFENVKGMTLGNHKIFIKELIQEFTTAKYRVIDPYRVLNAASYGVAQNRHRFILIGIREDQQDIGYPTETYGLTRNGQSSYLEQPFIGSKMAIEDLEDIEVFIDEDGGIPFSEVKYNKYTKKFSNSFSDEFKYCHVRTLDNPVIFGHVGSNHTITSKKRFSETPCGATEPISRFFKLDPMRPSNTLRAGTDSKRGAYTAARPIHYSKPRCISIREGARLHSFPDWFQFHLTIWHGFRQLGNSVAPIFAKELGAAIMQGLGINADDLPRRTLQTMDMDLLRFSMSDACKYFGVPDVIGKRDRKPLGDAS